MCVHVLRASCVSMNTCSFSYLAHHCLHDSVKASLWSVSISGDLLLRHLLGETCDLLRQRQHILEPKLSLALAVKSSHVQLVKGRWESIGKSGKMAT